MERPPRMRTGWGGPSAPKRCRRWPSTPTRRPLGRSGAAGGGPSSSPPSVTVRPDGAARDAVKLGLAAVALLVCWLGTKTNSEPRAHHRHHAGLPARRCQLADLVHLVDDLARGHRGDRLHDPDVPATLGHPGHRRVRRHRLAPVRPVGAGAAGPTGAGRPMADTPTSTWRSRWPGWPPRSRWSPRPCRTSAAGCSCAWRRPSGSWPSPPWSTAPALPLAVLASLAVGWGVTAVVHLVFGSPLGLPSADEVRLLLGDLEITAVDVAADTRPGVGRRPVRCLDRRRPGRRLGLRARRLRRPVAGQDGPLPVLPGLRTHPGPDPAAAGRARGLSDPDGRSGRGPGAGRAGGRTGRPGPGRTAGHPPTVGPPPVVLRRLCRAAE